MAYVQRGITESGNVKKFEGYSIDPKPSSDIGSGSKCYEQDTKKVWTYDSVNTNPRTNDNWWLDNVDKIDFADNMGSEIDLTDIRSQLVDIAYQLNSPYTGLMAALQNGYDDVAINVIGDSTGDAVDEWVYLLGTKLASLYPAYTVKSIVWNDTAQDYIAQGIIQMGTSGIRYIQLANTSAAAISDTGESITGDIDLRFYGLLPSWRNGTQTLISRFGNSGDRGFRFQIDSSGKLRFDWSSDGTNIQTAVTSTLAVPFADGSAGWVRATMDVDDGAGNHVITFYTSSDGVTWTQLGTSNTTTGVTSLYYGTWSYEVGARTGTAEQILNGGIVYEVQIRNGINGVLVCPVLPTLWNISAGTGMATIAGSPVLTIINGSKPGAGISYLGEATRIKKLTPNYGQAVVFLSSSHNEASTSGKAWFNLLSSWSTAVKQRIPFAPIIFLTQNPRYSPTNYIEEHGRRRRQTIGWAVANNYNYIDIYGAFLKDGRGASLINSDGIHPAQSPNSGQSVWLKAITDTLGI